MKLRTPSWRPAVMAYRRVVVALGLVLASCAVQPPAPTALSPAAESSPTAAAESSPTSSPDLASEAVTEGGITLAATAEPATAVAGMPIDVNAVLTHDRAGRLIVSGSGSGVVFFSVIREEDGLSSGPSVMTDDCSRHELAAETIVPFFPSNGYSADDPDVDFKRAYQQSPELRLPAGTWRIDVATSGSLGEGCSGPLLDLQVSLTVVVTE